MTSGSDQEGRSLTPEERAEKVWAEIDCDDDEHDVWPPTAIAQAIRDAMQEAAHAEREACARVAEEHTEHMDFSPGEHMEPPYICNVAEAIRKREECSFCSAYGMECEVPK